MQTTASETIITPEKFDAVLFDLDGVITATDKNHFTAWKKLFDSYLRDVSQRDKVPFQEFTYDDMLNFVDGRPRYEGIRCFLESRDLELPYGDPSDPEDAPTICGLGNRKNRFFNESIREDGVTVFEGTVALIRSLREQGIRIGVVSSSKNCPTVLKTAEIEDLFDVKFDGNIAAELKLRGKPDPDTYLKAAEWAETDANRAVVVEDAISGVQAGRSGGFGLVIGVDRGDNSETLLENGADIVVKDLGELLE
jgi:beta-phosphoglucomutase family hydrolase